MKTILLLTYLGLSVLTISCGVSTIFYNPNDLCEQGKVRKGKFKQADMDTRGKSNKRK